MCKNLIAFARQIANLDECQCQCQPTYLPASLPACLLACGGGYITGLSTQIANEALSPSINAGLNTHVHLLYTFTLPRKLHTPTPSLTLSLSDSLSPCHTLTHTQDPLSVFLSEALSLSPLTCQRDVLPLRQSVVFWVYFSAANGSACLPANGSL